MVRSGGPARFTKLWAAQSNAHSDRTFGGGGLIAGIAALCVASAHNGVRGWVSVGAGAGGGRRIASAASPLHAVLSLEISPQSAASCLITAHHGLVTASFRSREKHHIACASRNDSQQIERTQSRGTIMKTLLSTLLALSVLTGVAASASAYDTKTFYQEQDRSHY
jgi:hypothetical protein